MAIKPSDGDVGATEIVQAREGDAPSGASGASRGTMLATGAGGRAVRWLLATTPSWLFSTALHVAVLLTLGMMAIPRVRPIRFNQLVANSPDETLPQTDEVFTADGNASNSVDGEIRISTVPITADAYDSTMTGDSDRYQDVPRWFHGNARSGGVEPGQEGLVRASIGNTKREVAVQMALRWLANHQNPDGGWSFDLMHGPCQGRCGNSGNLSEARFAATGLALMAYLGVGQTHKKGIHKERVKAGLAYLIQHGSDGNYYESGGRMYGQGIASMALCEAYSMTRDKSLLAPAQASINFIGSAQDPASGGWSSAPRQAPDTSVVGWQVMALRSAQLARLTIPPHGMAGAAKFLDSVQTDGGAGYGHTGPQEDMAATSIGRLCRMLLGWSRDNPAFKRGAEKFSEWGPLANIDGAGSNRANMTYNYFATQFLHHFEGKLWTYWHKEMDDFLIKTQNRNGHAKGSWQFDDDQGSDVGGRLYCTAMATMSLEVYYRHQPLYRNAAFEDKFEE